ncbi:acylneuraminate cytidylyltransferase family protein [Sphaerothrix gracilis]|uniref:acylneuraminate cytidylyltransferase family protein n=1 Tax=Sphaerothrix gracilis TaxID=3151835 RepID=UPI0031FD03A8
MEKLGIVVLLPMKAHSERVKAKNFKVLHGKPLFQWILDTLLSISEIDKIVINTDARKKLESSGSIKSERVQIRDRKPELCGDTVSMNRILADDIEHVPADLYLMTHTTNPLLSSKTIRGALQAFSQSQGVRQADSLFAVNRFQTRFYRQDGSPINHDPQSLVPTQDLEPWYEENSNLYLFTAESFSATQARIGQRPLLFETPRLESIDIDNVEDWQLAEAVAQYLYPQSIQ